MELELSFYEIVEVSSQYQALWFDSKIEVRVIPAKTPQNLDATLSPPDSKPF